MYGVEDFINIRLGYLLVLLHEKNFNLMASSIKEH